MADHLIDCDCASQLGQMVKLAHQQGPEKVIFQTSLMSALLSGVYDGSMTVADLLEKGDFGLGTFNHLDGELVALDHQIYQLKSDGSAQQAHRGETKAASQGGRFCFRNHHRRSP